MINTRQVADMIVHWLGTPPNGYFGQGYGNNLAEELLKNTNAYNADKFLEKMKQDIPILNRFGADELAIVSRPVGFDKMLVLVQLRDLFIEISMPDKQSIDTTKDYYNAKAR